VPVVDTTELRVKRHRFKQTYRLVLLVVATVATVLPVVLDVRVALAIPVVLFGVVAMVGLTVAERVSRRVLGSQIRPKW
jgi:hypothetical protein